MENLDNNDSFSVTFKHRECNSSLNTKELSLLTMHVDPQIFIDLIFLKPLRTGFPATDGV